jgi:DNA primase
LKRYADEIVLVFDPDDAGASAALRGTELLLESGFNVRIATVPDGLDPDELLHKSGAEAFKRCLAEAKDLPDFQTTWALSKVTGPLTAEAKDRIAGAVLASINKAESAVLKDEWIRRLAQRLGLGEESLRFQISHAKSPAYAPARRAAVGSEPKRVAADPLPPSDRAVLQALFKKPALSTDEGKVVEEDLESQTARNIFVRLREMAKEGLEGSGASWSGALLQSLPPEIAAVAGGLLVDDTGAETDPEEQLSRVVTEKRLLHRYWELDAKMSSGASKDPAAAKEYRDLLKRLSDLRLMDRLKEPRPAAGSSNFLQHSA